MTTVTTTLNKSLDEAVAEMPLFRRVAWQSRLRFSGFRRRTLESLRENLHDDERAIGVSVVLDNGPEALSFQDALAQDSFTADTPFAIDIDKLRELLKLILEFLPLILKLFTGFASVVVFVALTFFPTVAEAQGPLRRLLFGNQQQTYATQSSCPGGVCPAQSYSSPGRWKNDDGLSFREHARVMHGIDTSGMTDAQVAQLRDHDHDQYGGDHPEFLRSLPNRALHAKAAGPRSKVVSQAQIKAVTQPPIPQPKGWL